MTFETPIQPVPVRKTRVTLALVAILGAAALLVWHPWTAVPGAPLTAAPVSAGPSSSARPTAKPAASQEATVPRSARRFNDTLTADRFQPRWSVVGVRDLSGGGYRITQLPLIQTTGLFEGLSSAEICARARERFPYVAALPGDALRLFGAIALRGGHGWVQLRWIEAANRVAFAVPVRYPTGTEDLGVALFGLTDGSLWPAGAYRFEAVDNDGRSTNLYACLAG